MKKGTVFLWLFTLVLSSFSPITAYAVASGAAGSDAAVIRVLDEAPVYSEDDASRELGKVASGAVFRAKEVKDGRVYIQWDNGWTYLNEGEVAFTDGVHRDEIFSDESETAGTFAVVEGSDVRTADGDVLAYLPEGAEYAYIGHDEIRYEILLGNRIGYVDASRVKETSSAGDESRAREAEEADEAEERTGTFDGRSESRSAETTAAREEQGERDEPIRSAVESERSIHGNTPFSVQAVETLEFGTYFQVTEDGLTVYDNSSGKLVPVGTLVKGQSYPRLRDYGNWHEISFGNRKGYVWKASTVPSDGKSIRNLNQGDTPGSRTFTAKQNLTVYDNTSGTLEPFATIGKGQQHPIVSDYGNWYRVDVSGRIGYVHKSGVTVNFQTGDRYFQVTEDGLTVYDNSSGKLVPVGTLVKGQSYPRLRDYGNWHEISFGNRKGYVWKASTVPSDGKSIRNLNQGDTPGSRTFTAKQNLTVYDNTSGTLEPFATIGKGQQHPIVSDYGNWYRVDVSGRIGYVHKGGVEVGFTKSDQYFQVTVDNLTVYDNSTGNLKPVGTLVKGEIYPRVRDYGNWHEIKFGNWYGYVWKEGTQPSDGQGIRNLNRIYKNFAGGFETLKDVTVYDNTHPSGELIPFATIREGEIYPYVSTYGQNWFRVDVSGRIGYVRSRDVTRHRIVYTPYNYTLEQMLDIQMRVNPQTDLYGGGWKKAKREDVRRYLDPNNHDMFQHLVLSKSVGAPETVLNKVLEGKGILSGKGKSFIEAGKKHGVNEIYLIAHALHETGNGRSTLATGVKYNGKTVYNMYGIGARDSCPVSCGAKKAYEEGWDTPEKAIVEGAAWIARGYINSGQDTLYKMRWNPSNPGTHQYATDIGWAVKQVSRIKNLYEQLPAFPLLFDIPKYK